jgi:AAA15 family ATPase/GTPase
MSSRTPMPTPPGGELVCPTGQMPKIKVVSGQIFAECCAPPQGVTPGTTHSSTFLRWAISKIKEDAHIRNWKEYRLSDIDNEIIRNEYYKYKNPKGELVVIFFKIPVVERSIY